MVQETSGKKLHFYDRTTGTHQLKVGLGYSLIPSPTSAQFKMAGGSGAGNETIASWLSIIITSCIIHFWGNQRGFDKKTSSSLERQSQ